MPNRKVFNKSFEATGAETINGATGGLPDGYQPTGWAYLWVPDNGTDKIYFKSVTTSVSGFTFTAQVEGAGDLTFIAIGVDGLTYQGQAAL